MKTFDERFDDVMAKIEVRRQKQRKMRKRLITGSCVAVVMTALALILFLPFNTNPPDVSRYSDSPYYSLIQRINAATYQKPQYKNNFEKLVESFSRFRGVKSDGFLVMDSAPLYGAPESAPVGGTYQEVTDNQVEGVIEGDLIKRSDKYIYYLRNGVLSVYSIEKEDSTLVGQFTVNDAQAIEGKQDLTYYFYGEDVEMYLSEDCSTITVIFPAYHQKDKDAYICVLNLDVTDPENITVSNRIFLTGSNMTARLVDGDFLIMGKYAVISSNIDFSKEETFVPQIGLLGNMTSIPAGNIIFPDELTNLHYTVVCKLDGKTLEAKDAAAFLSYSDNIYVSKENVYASRSFVQQEGTDLEGTQKSVTEISSIRYTGDNMQFNGSVIVDGTVKNHYSMDEYEGILRVVTSTNETITTTNGMTASARLSRNASLYCIDLATWQVVASVEKFAPENEQAESVRFDGYNAYVCTAEVITLTDPVYYFDLSDLNNITYKDTGTIDGYSSSLVQLGDGYLLGIGYSANRTLKIEVYQETQSGVESVCSYEGDFDFSTIYKSYLIDRENRLVGLGIYNFVNGETYYLLVQFDGYVLQELLLTPFEGEVWDMRAVQIDGYLYLLGEGFRVEKIW